MAVGNGWFALSLGLAQQKSEGSESLERVFREVGVNSYINHMFKLIARASDVLAAILDESPFLFHDNVVFSAFPAMA